MGMYINPTNMTKEEWLHVNALQCSVFGAKITETHIPVCLVDNGSFKAAAVAYSPRELAAFSYEGDRRSKQWYMVERRLLREQFGLLV